MPPAAVAAALRGHRQTRLARGVPIGRSSSALSNPATALQYPGADDREISRGVPSHLRSSPHSHVPAGSLVSPHETAPAGRDASGATFVETHARTYDPEQRGRFTRCLVLQPVATRRSTAAARRVVTRPTLRIWVVLVEWLRRSSYSHGREAIAQRSFARTARLTASPASGGS